MLKIETVRLNRFKILTQSYHKCVVEINSSPPQLHITHQ